jgi:GntR family transcriptional regulator/MocR family aminotransferase
MLSELIYEGEIHRLLKKNILVYKQDAIFYTNVLKKILKMLSVLKPTGGLAIWLQFSTVISLIQLSEQALRYDLFCLKPYFIKTRHVRYPFRLWPFE